MIDLAGQLPPSPVDAISSLPPSDAFTGQAGSVTAPAPVSGQGGTGTGAAMAGMPVHAALIPVLMDGHIGPAMMIRPGQWNDI
jgi:hypothetical protein